MGLGKTAQLIAALLADSVEGATLVVCPVSVLGNWERELARFVPSLDDDRDPLPLVSSPSVGIDVCPTAGRPTGGVWWGMARRPTPHLWVAMLLVVAGLGFGGGAVASATEPTTADRPAAVALTPTVIDVAVVPARIDARPRAVGQSAYGRSLLPLVALLLTLAGLIGSTAGRSVAPVVGHAPLLSRRHAIALRAPPSLQLV